MSVPLLTEIEYLRYVYNSLEDDEIIPIYNARSGVVPPNYYILVCKECNEQRAISVCDVCFRPLCSSCKSVCESSKKVRCFDHFDACELCELGCTCPTCKIYTTDHLCNVCSNEYELTVSCGCEIQHDGSCMICGLDMDEFTKERIN